MRPWEFLLASLAVWRLTHLLVAEDGPSHLMVRLRQRVGNNFWGSLLDCFYCLSFWMSLPFTLLLGGQWREWVLLWPALSAAAILWERVIERLARHSGVFWKEEGEPSPNEEEEHNELLRKN